MTRTSEVRSEETPSRLSRMTQAVGRLFGRGRHEEEGVTLPQPESSTRGSATPAQPRPVKRETDIPLEELGRTYTPTATSSKQSFRSDGADHQSDQEFAHGSSDERWRDEDRFTNKSGDPRIGTRGRTYEPEEQRNESRD